MIGGFWKLQCPGPTVLANGASHAKSQHLNNPRILSAHMTHAWRKGFTGGRVIVDTQPCSRFYEILVDSSLYLFVTCGGDLIIIRQPIRYIISP